MPKKFKTGQYGSKFKKKKSPTVLSRRGKAKAPKVPKAKAPKVPKPTVTSRRDEAKREAYTGKTPEHLTPGDPGYPEFFTKPMSPAMARKITEDLIPLARRYTSGLIALNAYENFATSNLPQILEPAFHPVLKAMPQAVQKAVLMKLGVYPVTGALTQGYNYGRGAGLSASMLLQPAPPDSARGQAMSGKEFAQNFPAFSEKYGEELERRGIKFYIDQAGGLQAWNRLTPWVGGR